MATIPTYQVYTKRKLEADPNIKPVKKRKRLGYREFRESELQQLDEVLDESNVELKGIYAINLCKHVKIFKLVRIQKTYF